MRQAAAGPSQRPPTIRLRSPGEVAESVPYLLGFHPADSLVLLSLRGTRSRLGLCMRADLPTPDDVRTLASHVVAKLCDDGARAAVLLVYGPEADPAGMLRPSRRDVVDACTTLLVEAGVHLRDALQVAHGRWWSYLCGDHGCCPAEGTPLPTEGLTDTSAAWAFAGRAALPDRAAVLGGLQPPCGEAAREARRVLRRVRAEQRRACSASGSAVYEDQCVEMFHHHVERYAQHPRWRVGEEAAARLAVAVRPHGVRDEVLLWATGERGEAFLRLLSDVLSRVPPPYDTAVATVYAWVVYQQGDGVLARAAVDRALASDPCYRLALLLGEALDAGTPPAALAEVGVRARLDRHRRDTGTELPGTPQRTLGP